MKGLLILILLLPAWSSSHAQEPLNEVPQWPVADTTFLMGDTEGYARFIKDLDQFNRKMGGCPLVGPATGCVAGAGVFDLRLWDSLSRRGMKIFGRGRIEKMPKGRTAN